MSKKRKKTKGSPLKRIFSKRQKDQHVITLEGDMRGDIPPSTQCTCGWVFGPSSKLMELGLAAKNHALETGHILRRHG